MEDREAIESILAGHPEDFAHLVRKYQARVLRLCASLMSDSTLAEDAAQDIFLKAYSALSRFRGDASFSTWLYRIAANHCKDLLRKRSREKTQSWEALVEEQGERIEQLLTEPSNPIEAAAHAELANKVLSFLPADYRAILSLREAEGLSYEEIAEVLGCSVNAVKSRLRRAREALQTQLRHFLRQACV